MHDLRDILPRITAYLRSQQPIKRSSRVLNQTFRDSFQRQGWIEKRTVQRWAPRKATERGRSRGILIQSGRLRRGIRTRVRSRRKAEISNDVPYAKAHNEGETIRQSIAITPKMRKFFWAKYYETQDERWKAMALSKGPINRTITLPERRFMGVSPFVEERILKNLERDIINLLNKRPLQ